MQAFFRIVAEEAGAGKGEPELERLAAALERASGDLQTATMWLMQHGMANPNNAGAAAYPYMTMMGIVSLGLMWLRIASASAQALRREGEEQSYHRAKLTTARFFAARNSSANDLDPTPHERLRLHGDGDDIGALFPCIWRVLCFDTPLEVGNSLGLSNELALV